MTEENAKDTTATAEEVVDMAVDRVENGDKAAKAESAAEANDAEEPQELEEPKESGGPKDSEKPKAKEPLAHGTKIRIAIAAACVLVVAACAIATFRKSP